MKHWQTILVRVLWSIAGAALIVLFVVAWKAKEEKKYNSIQIELVGENTAALFIDEKEILQIIHEQGVKEGQAIGELNLNTLEKYLETIRWVKQVELFLDNAQVLQVKIEQRIPIARIFTASGNSFYIDKERCVYVYGYRGFDGKITYLLEHTEGSKKENPAIFSGTDILAEDWEVIEDKE
jgi:cell division protein FtsQ